VKSLCLLLLVLMALIRPACAQSCTTSSTGFVFGAYQPLTGSPSLSTGTVTVNCNPALISILVSYTISLGPGSGGSFASRSMSGAGGVLGYQLYRDALRTQIWGDGTAGTTTVTDGYLLGLILPVLRNYTVYGRIPGGLPVGIGAYSDTVLIVVSY
jgi:spore coat protein U-like protein